MFMVFAVLVVLLGVMAYIINPKPQTPPESDPAQMKKMQERQAEAQKHEVEERKKMMEEAMKHMKKANAKSVQAKGTTAPPKGGMDISGDWWKKRKSGETGIEQLQKENQTNSASAAPSAPTPVPAVHSAPLVTK